MRPVQGAASRAGLLAAGGVAVFAVAGVAAWFALQPAASPAVAVAPAPVSATLASVSTPSVAADPIPVATAGAIRDEVPAVRTVLRFAANPAVVVIDFPTLAEQGRMLNRVAAWAEKAGVPHDRLLTDLELAEAIQASGATADTYYYGHDYRGADIGRFFDLADRAGVVLRPEEQELRRLRMRAQLEPDGFGAVITLVRASAENGVTPVARGSILDHELSHGEYFTSPAYAAFVETVWQSVLSPAERAAFRTYLAAEGYDPALEDLIRNEMQAYLMHTPDREFFDPDKLGIPAPRLAQIRAAFLAGMPPGWLRDETARMMPDLPVPKPSPVARKPGVP